MTTKAKEELKRADQAHLRTMVLQCMRDLWKYWKSSKAEADAKLLKETVDRVLELIRSFETGRGQIEQKALAGISWGQLRKLAEKIAASLKADAKEAKASVSHEGHGTPALVKLALEKRGGQATTAEIIEWVETNKNKAVVKKTGVCLNSKDTTAKDRREGTKVWHLTVSSCLSSRPEFVKVDSQIPNGPWRLFDPDVACEQVGKRRRVSRR